MFARLGKKQIIAVWTAIFLLGIAAAAWGARRARVTMRQACGVQADAFAAALDPEQLEALEGGRGRPDDPGYRPLEMRLARLQAADTRARWVFLLRPGSLPGKFIFLVGSARTASPGALRPGDDYGEAAHSAALSSTARTGWRRPMARSSTRARRFL